MVSILLHSVTGQHKTNVLLQTQDLEAPVRKACFGFTLFLGVDTDELVFIIIVHNAKKIHVRVLSIDNEGTSPVDHPHKRCCILPENSGG